MLFHNFCLFSSYFLPSSCVILFHMFYLFFMSFLLPSIFLICPFSCYSLSYVLSIFRILSSFFHLSCTSFLLLLSFIHFPVYFSCPFLKFLISPPLSSSFGSIEKEVPGRANIAAQLLQWPYQRPSSDRQRHPVKLCAGK